ncbi:Cof-type HAD-IIB family hydrolase [Xanthovirga aplysinae]|uniref:Cof-type HAD-IIB family hydrolase n=1 Tax=Xanthovirga aplysinae TaxID=2529853 RepID=UPI0012BCD4EC|nr:Cof-type HAD-IIB family hydrolase [Xanthovirga aplysinae]MTI32296.1 Cof-type HAD-IIB family hydrolase [Xanthovirga aplysinae]
MKDIQAVVIDLDGTLLNNNHEVTKFTKKVIRNIVERGIHLFIATGRHPVDVRHFCRKMGVETYLLCCNGGMVYNKKGELISTREIEGGISRKLLNITTHPEVYTNVYQNELWFAEQENEALNAMHIESGFECEIIEFEQMPNYTINKVFYYSHNPLELAQLETRLVQKFGDQLSIYPSSKVCLEVMPKGVNKGNSLSELFESLQIRRENVLAFGDGQNDIEMLGMVGKGLIMKNADSKLIEALPHLEIISSNNENGVAQYLSKVLLQENSLQD